MIRVIALGKRLILTYGRENGILVFLCFFLCRAYILVNDPYIEARLLLTWRTAHNIIRIVKQHCTIGMPHKGKGNPIEIAFCPENSLLWKHSILCLCVCETILAQLLQCVPALA